MNKNDKKQVKKLIKVLDKRIAKKKTYNVIWSERMSVNVRARNAQEAREIVLNCQYNEQEVSSELDNQPEAYLIK